MRNISTDAFSFLQSFRSRYGLPVALLLLVAMTTATAAVAGLGHGQGTAAGGHGPPQAGGPGPHLSAGLRAKIDALIKEASAPGGVHSAPQRGFPGQHASPLLQTQIQSLLREAGHPHAFSFELGLPGPDGRPQYSLEIVQPAGRYHHQQISVEQSYHGGFPHTAGPHIGHGPGGPPVYPGAPAVG